MQINKTKNDNGEKIRHLDGSCECAFDGIQKELKK